MAVAAMDGRRTSASFILVSGDATSMFDSTFRVDQNGGMSVRKTMQFIVFPGRITPKIPFRVKWQHDCLGGCVLIRHWVEADQPSQHKIRATVKSHS